MKIVDRPGVKNRMWVRILALSTCFALAYWVPLKAMVSIWLTDEEYSYGFLIPMVSIYFLWEKKDVLRTMPLKGAWVFFPALFSFVLLSLYGVLGSSGNIAMPAVPILIVLFAAFCFGKEAMKELLLPLGFLIFMVPVPPIIERYLGVILKGISSKMGGMIIDLFNIPVHVSGNVIDLGVTQLQVVDACSGMRYLFALFALGVVYAYFFERVTWKRIAAVLSTIPIAVITNGVRIGITGLLTDKYGVTVAEGFFHGFSGWVLFMVAFGCLFIVGRVLALFPPKERWTLRGKGGKGAATGDSEASVPGPERSNLNGPFVVSVCLLIVVAALSLSTKAMPPVKIEGGLSRFPTVFAGWQGKAETVDPEIVIRSGAEESYSGFYENEKKEGVSLYLGYRSSAFLSNENFFHSPTVCLPSQGWKIGGESTRIIMDVPKFGHLKVSRLIMENMDRKQLVYFWFQTKDKTTYDKNINRFHLSIHALKRDNTYDFFIRPITPIYPGESVGDAEKRLDGFTRSMMGTLFVFLDQHRQTE